MSKILVACCAENNKKFLDQAMRLSQSIRWFGGTLSDCDILLCVASNQSKFFDINYEKIFSNLNVIVRFVLPYCSTHPYSNRLRLFEQPEFNQLQYDFYMLMDCDTLVVQDPTSYFNNFCLSAKIADDLTVPRNVFIHIFKKFNVPIPKVQYKTFTGKDSFLYCNTGVLLIPSKFVHTLFKKWIFYTKHLLSISSSFSNAGARKHIDQIALSLVLLTENIPFCELPSKMNFPLHFALRFVRRKSTTSFNNLDPLIIHYHNYVNPKNGTIKKISHEYIQKRINLFNKELQRFEGDLVLQDFWNTRYENNPKLGSGIGSQGSILEYKKKILEEQIQLIKPKNVLDVGCGDIRFVTEIFKDIEYVGFDISPTIIKLNNTRKISNFSFICGSFTSYSFSKLFDLVLCFDVLIHQNIFRSYNLMVKNLVHHTAKCGIITAYLKAPKKSSNIIYYYEPITTTLKRWDITKFEIIGSYRAVSIIKFIK